MTDSSDSPRLSWFDARVGDRMIEVLCVVNENGPYPSMSAIAEDIYPERATTGTNSPVVRCVNRGLLKRDRHHESRSRGSHGAILITDDGRRLLRMYGYLDDADGSDSDTTE